jgi:hypothetical protein
MHLRHLERTSFWSEWSATGACAVSVVDLPFFRRQFTMIILTRLRGCDLAAGFKTTESQAIG